MKVHALALAAVATIAMGTAKADTYTFSGSVTLTDATFNRPLTLTSLSGVGTAVHYDVAALLGVTAGEYTFSMTSTGFDTFLALYAGAFNPASPLTNLVALDDDSGAGSNSLFTYTLVPNQFYTIVSTAFSNTGVGDYITTVTPVPEASTYGMMLLGLAAIGGRVLRRRQHA